MSEATEQEKTKKQESPRIGFVPLDPFNRVAWICGILPACISLIALLGWEINLLSLASLSAAYIPMAPNTALAFFILSGVLLLYIYEPRNTFLLRIAKTGLVFVVLLGLVTLFQVFSGVDMGIDEVLHRTSQKFDKVLIGRMSPITAASFIFASLALWFLLFKSAGGKWVTILAAIPAVTVIAVGWVVVLGYMYQAPLLYGQTIIPMALTTGIAFIFTGTGIIAAIGPESWPLNSLIGSSMRARLLRVFLPVTAAIVLIQGWVQTVATLRLTNPALKSALMAAFFLVVVGIIVSQIARIIGGAIDQSESERRRAEDLVQHIAFYDALTDLPNRNMLYDRLLNGIRINEGNPMALMIMDLDRFKEINDTLGHPRGDLLLQQVGARLKNTLFKPDVVARLGGDEFAILLLKLASLEHVDLVIQKILRALEMPFVIEGIPIIVEASIGIALYPDHGTDPDSLIQKADVAMYGAKRSGSYNIYSIEDDHYSPRRLALMGELRQAIEQNQLFLHYQPKIDLKTRRFTGVEALVRWRHPKHGVIPPDQFIGPAEQTGLIAPLTQWVLRSSLEQHVRWRERQLNFPISINLSTRNLLDPKLPDFIMELFVASGVGPGQLDLEITESAIMTDPEAALNFMKRLKAIDIRFSIDDFGVGYTSLSYLKKLPVDTLKIDKSFVINMTKNENDSIIVRSTIDLAKNLGLKVVAEGVENQDALERLLDLGCHEAQGYFFSRPLPADDLALWTKESPWGSRFGIKV